MNTLLVEGVKTYQHQQLVPNKIQNKLVQHLHPTVGKTCHRAATCCCTITMLLNWEEGSVACSSCPARSGSRPQDKGVSSAKASKDAAKFRVTDALLVLYVFVTKTRKVYQQYFSQSEFCSKCFFNYPEVCVLQIKTVLGCFERRYFLK